jgi:kynurenine formamidase
MTLYYDLTQQITHHMPVYPGDIPVEIVPLGTDDIRNQALTCSMHIGTHIDSPSHMLLGGKTLNDFPLSSFIGNGILIDARGKRSLDSNLLSSLSLQKGDIVLIFTGFGSNFYEPHYFSSYPAVTLACAQALIKAGIKMIGIDTPSPDYAPFEVHKLLMEHDILIIENVTNLELLLDVTHFEVIALPLKTATDGSLARVIAKVEK